MSVLCKELWETKKDSLKKESIFLLKYENEIGMNKTPERDFEFFVFVDPEDEEKRPDFIRELYQYLCKDDNSFAQQEHKEELKKWLHLADNDTALLTPLNWLKVAIERYPYRLFVVIDSEKWQDDKGFSPLDDEFWFTDKTPPEDITNWEKSPFLYKRICWVERKEFENLDIKITKNSEKKQKDDVNLKQEEKFKLWLYVRWIHHLQNKICSLTGNIVLVKRLFDPGGSTDDIYNPVTLPKNLRLDKSKNLKTTNKKYNIAFLEKRMWNTFKILSTKKPQSNNSDNKSENSIIIIYARHRNFYELQGGWKKDDNFWSPLLQKKTDSQKNVVIYSENLSGILSYWNMLKSLDEQNELTYNKVNFDLWLIENGLLNICIIDERVQEKYFNIEAAPLGRILQTKVFPAFFDQSGKYGQISKSSTYEIIFNSDNYMLQFSSPQKNKLITDFLTENPRIDCLLIHQGILDKLKREKHLKKEYLLKLKENIPFLIITSGRGKTKEIPIEAKFVHFSEVHKCMLNERIEKLILTLIISKLIQSKEEYDV